MKIMNVLMFSLVTAMLLFSVVGCTQSPTGEYVKVGSDDPIKIGVVLPMTGEAASWGENAFAGITLALNEVNAQGGISGQEVEVVLEDDSCSASSVAAFNKEVNVDQVDAIVGPICSAAAGPAIPIAQSANVPVMMVAASAPDLTSVGDCIFRIYPSDSLQGVVGAEYMMEELGYDKVALVYTKNDWGEGMKNVFTKSFEEMGGEIVYESGVLQTDTDFRTEITKIKNSGAEAIFAPIYPTNAVAFFKQAEELSLNLPMLGGDAWQGEEVWASGYGDGAIYSTVSIEQSNAFENKIHALPGYENLEISIAASLGYDAFMVMVEAIEDAGSTDANDIKAALRDTSYSGESNDLIQFDEIGDIASAGYDFFMIKDSESVLLK
ncbi:MAG: penicillin-binding protein activator [archaeon]|nr:penicillin-binding protein activator [Nanoarchaeota archaeon]